MEGSSTAQRWSTRAPWVCGLTVVLATVGVRPVSAAQESRGLYQIRAVRVDEGPVLDGVLDEAVWQTAAVIDEFIQQEPAEGAPATERTEVWVLHDERNLYVAMRAFDSLPDGVIATEMRRDSDRLLEEDNFQIILDTFNDSRSAYMFVTSPLGAKLDQQVFEEGEGGRRGISSNINRDWDGVWHVSARRTPNGWTAEIAIPMVTLRFPDAETQDWGINFMRNIRRKNEQVFWAPIPKAYSLTRVSLAGSLIGLRSLSRGRDLRIKPFLVGGGRRVLSSGDADNSVQRDMGLDVKYGVSAGLNLDVTVNTDFAQAEVDDERAKLTRFALFFPEKREFFLENAVQFNVGTTASFDRLADLFFSRRIGLSETGAHVPILGGARLSGKVGRHNLAVMDIQTDEAFGRPGENFLVARYSRDVFARSKVGGIFINKEATGGGHFNRTSAADMTLALHPSLTVNGFVAKTSTPGVSDGQFGGHLRAGWLNRAWNIYGEYTDLQDNFNAEVGFVPRRGIRTSKFHIERNPRPGRFGIRVLEPMVNITYTTDQDNRLLTRRIHQMLGTRLENGAYINIWYNDYFEQLDEPFAVQGDVVIAPGAYRFGEWRFSFSSDPSRRLYHSVSYSPQTFFDGTRTDIDLRLGVRATSQLATEVGYSRNAVDLPAGAFTVDIGSIRLDYAVSPNMTLRALTQYNSSSHQWSTSARFNFIYRPGSDLYIVYDEVRRDVPGLAGFRDRQLILKFTYLLSR
ncbi:MAG: carbohydrate binding family 9 domain-containing protein [Gemmatimonadetes bacterium]|nr:carbohydrate binding family 9 domain-containing protein [Gemmatimonadota bacterium]